LRDTSDRRKEGSGTDREGRHERRRSMAELRFTVSEVTVSSGKQTTIPVYIDGERVKIPVAAEVRAHFKDQFERPNPSALQKRRHATVMQLLRAAYNKGKQDGAAAK
jgi:hypothetical protein